MLFPMLLSFASHAAASAHFTVLGSTELALVAASVAATFLSMKKEL